VSIETLADRAAAHARAYLAHVGERPVGATLTPDELRALLGGPLAAEGQDPARVIDTLAERMAGRLARHPGVRILNQVVLNQVLVQFRPPGGDDAAADAMTREVIRQVQQGGVCWAGGTWWQGQPAMRISIANWTTTVPDVDRSADAILAAVDAIDPRRYGR
jgi:hypothetical protein